MAQTLTIEPDDQTMGWLLFVDHRPVSAVNRDLQAFMNLAPGKHRLVLDVRGAGSTVAVTIDGGATLVSPDGGWPLRVTVPDHRTGQFVEATFTV